MKSKIIADSCMDYQDPQVTYVPFTITIEGKDYVDTEDLDVRSMVDHMNRSKDGILTSCPSPGDYLQAMKDGVEDGYEDIYVITISDKLSGSHNSAVLAKSMLLEEHPDINIAVFDSKSAVSGETLIYLELKRLIEEGVEFHKIVEIMTDYIEKMGTLFTLESIDNLVKNGRMSRPAGAVASVLSIKPIAAGDNGEIVTEAIARGTRNALRRIVKNIQKHTDSTEGKTIVISHIFAPEKAEEIKKLVEEEYDFKDIYIVEGRGLSSGYAADEGIVIAFDGR